ncbi:MAG: hypothetical protein LC748_00620 [Thermomicrobia bacterium]|nr:hypothetical protein [Thermomicrobia bacterium]
MSGLYGASRDYAVADSATAHGTATTPAAGAVFAFTLPRITLAASTAFNAVAIALATTGAVYHATIVATRLTA